MSGVLIQPVQLSPPGTSKSWLGEFNSISWDACPPRMSYNLSDVEFDTGILRMVFPSETSLNPTLLFEIAWDIITSTIFALSVAGLLWKDNLAGVFLKISLTDTVVPYDMP